MVNRYENKRILINSQLSKLLSPPALVTKSGKDLQNLLNTVNEAVRGLKSLGAPVDHWVIFLVYQLVKNLDSASREAWELHLGPSSDYPTLDELKTFIGGRARAKKKRTCAFL